MKRRAPVRRAITARPAAICSPTAGSRRAFGLNDTLLQKVQPPRPLLPSRFGQVKPAWIAILCTRRPWRRNRSWPKVLTIWGRGLDIGDLAICKPGLCHPVPAPALTKVKRELSGPKV